MKAFFSLLPYFASLSAVSAVHSLPTLNSRAHTLQEIKLLGQDFTPNIAAAFVLIDSSYANESEYTSDAWVTNILDLCAANSNCSSAAMFSCEGLVHCDGKTTEN